MSDTICALKSRFNPNSSTFSFPSIYFWISIKSKEKTNASFLFPISWRWSDAVSKNLFIVLRGQMCFSIQICLKGVAVNYLYQVSPLSFISHYGIQMSWEKEKFREQFMHRKDEVRNAKKMAWPPQKIEEGMIFGIQKGSPHIMASLNHLSVVTSLDFGSSKWKSRFRQTWPN